MKDADREELLERLLSGDLDPASPEALRVFDDDSRARFAELGELAARLDDAGREQRAVIAAARSTASSPETAATLPGADRVRSTLTALAAPGRAGAPRGSAGAPRGLPWRLFAAAAVLLGLFGAVWWLGSGRPERPERRDEHFLGGAELELAPLEWTAGADGRDTLRWRPNLPAGGWYTLEIWDAAALGGAQPLVSETELEESAWTTSEELPQKVRIRVRAFGPGGEVLGVLDQVSSR